jgi:hypothetical protein
VCCVVIAQFVTQPPVDAREGEPQGEALRASRAVLNGCRNFPLTCVAVSSCPRLGVCWDGCWLGCKRSCKFALRSEGATGRTSWA